MATIFQTLSLLLASKDELDSSIISLIIGNFMDLDSINRDILELMEIYTAAIQLHLENLAHQYDECTCDTPIVSYCPRCEIHSDYLSLKELFKYVIE